MTSGRTVTKSVRLNADESALVTDVSSREHLAEGALLRKIILDGLARYRLDLAIADYEVGEINRVHRHRLAPARIL